MFEMLPMCMKSILSSSFALVNGSAVKGYQFIPHLSSSFTYGDAVLYILVRFICYLCECTET